MGRWSQQGPFAALNTAYARFVSPSALLATADWPVDADLTQAYAYFDDRLCVEVPESVASLVYSGLMAQLLSSIDKVSAVARACKCEASKVKQYLCCLQLVAAGAPVPKSVANLVLALRHYRTALIQDALELAPKYPEHPVYKWLLETPEFTDLLATYQANKAAGVRTVLYTTHAFSVRPRHC